MSKARIRTLALIGNIGVLVVSPPLVLIGLLVGAIITTDSGGTHVTSVGNPAVFAVGLLLTCAFGVVALVAWIFALIRTAQLQRWGWFVCMFVMGSLVSLIWSLAGPDTPAPTVNIS
jgi:hypothetical protein